MWLRRKPQSDSDRVEVLVDWPQPVVVAEPRLFADEHGFLLFYGVKGDHFAVVRSRHCTYLSFGAPNDEALGGHPLSKNGLQFYTFHEVHSSSLIRELERRNSIHPRHNASMFRDKRHIIATFQDSTFECVITTREPDDLKIEVCNSLESAMRAWQTPYTEMMPR